jgi:hypothetical protein
MAWFEPLAYEKLSFHAHTYYIRSRLAKMRWVACFRITARNGFSLCTLSIDINQEPLSDSVAKIMIYACLCPDEVVRGELSEFCCVATTHLADVVTNPLEFRAFQQHLFNPRLRNGMEAEIDSLPVFRPNLQHWVWNR